MITSTLTLLAALTLVGPTYKCMLSGICNRQKPANATSEFHSNLIALGRDIDNFILFWSRAGWTNLTVISSNQKEHFDRENMVQFAVWEWTYQMASREKSSLST